MNPSRRDLAILMPVLLAAGKVEAAELPKLLTTVLNRDETPATGTNTIQHRYLKGSTHENIPVQVHESDVPSGQAPHAPHKHRHEELVLVRNGTLEVFIEGREKKRVTAGGVIYVASNELHGWTNVGDGRAQYVVIAIGND